MADELTIKQSDEARLARVLAWFESHGGRPPSPKPGDVEPAGRPNAVVMLLDDLESGLSAEAAVLVRSDTERVWVVTIRGNPTGGRFELRFRPEGQGTPVDQILRTFPIDHDADAEQVQSRLAAIPLLRRAGVRVSLGSMERETDDPVHVFRWIVAFDRPELLPEDGDLTAAQFEGLTGLDGEEVQLSGLVAIAVTEAAILDDSGDRERVWSVIPVGTPTPLVRGAIGVAQWFHGIGYGLTAVECRQLREPEGVDPYEGDGA